MDPATKLACLLFGRSALSALGPSGISTIVIAASGALWIGLAHSSPDTSGGFIELAMTAVFAVSMLSTTGRQLHVEVWKLRREQGLLQLLSPTSGTRQALACTIASRLGRHLLAHVLPPFSRPRRVGLLERKTARCSWYSLSVCLQPDQLAKSLTACARSTRHCETSAALFLLFRPTGASRRAAPCSCRSLRRLGLRHSSPCWMWKAREAAQSRHPLLIARVD